jgi:hypothetical protein
VQGTNRAISQKWLSLEVPIQESAFASCYFSKTREKNLKKKTAKSLFFLKNFGSLKVTK